MDSEGVCEGIGGGWGGEIGKEMEDGGWGLEGLQEGLWSKIAQRKGYVGRDDDGLCFRGGGG